METEEKSARLITQKQKADLVAQAKSASSHARCPYSHFGVGAALLLKDGSVITGFNIESPAFSTTICAERCTIFTAIATRNIQPKDVCALAIWGPTPNPVSPCGSCRQVIMDQLGKDCEILLGGACDEIIDCSAEELLFHPFLKEAIA